jgi:hypothetical protein
MLALGALVSGKANPVASLYGTTTLDRHARARRELSAKRSFACR